MGNLPDISELLLWGVPIIAFIAAFIAFLKSLGVSDTAAKVVDGVLFCLLVFGVLSEPEWGGLYPQVEKWGQIVLWTITLYLIKNGFYEQLKLGVRRFMARHL